jgi:hypothetical protein
MSAYIQGRLEDAVLSGSVIWDRVVIQNPNGTSVSLILATLNNRYHCNWGVTRGTPSSLEMCGERRGFSPIPSNVETVMSKSEVDRRHRRHRNGLNRLLFIRSAIDRVTALDIYQGTRTHSGALVYTDDL